MLIEPDLHQLAVLAKEKKSENKKLLERLKKKPPKDLDYKMLQWHQQEFEHTDCLQCANCCKTTGPLFTTNDIERIAKHLRLKPVEFMSKYLREDEDHDWVLQQLPCVFLDTDNYCLIYDVRPKACKEYPHTDRKKFQQIGAITLKNTEICPAVYNILEKMKKNLL